MVSKGGTSPRPCHPFRYSRPESSAELVLFQLCYCCVIKLLFYSGSKAVGDLIELEGKLESGQQTDFYPLRLALKMKKVL